MHTLLVIIHIVVSIFLCLVILLQSGKGDGMGATFGGGASSQIFGGRGAGDFLSRVTSAAAVVFFLTSLTLSMMSSRDHSVVHGKTAPPEKPAPITETAPSATPAQSEAAPQENAAAPSTPEKATPAPAAAEAKPNTAGASSASAPAAAPAKPAAEAPAPPAAPAPADKK
jgi:preprotein translocase subunit SecG